ncbi:Transposable element P transposase [Frankliniella fusca]|uniref:Transposable element P transposase n=1 Tax=Frankliniella fusca TaxID=407009 RepID=A0AAE1H6R8_9NEOP|nr:Transposable element P transposase [Frankliniella fusca]
MPKVPRRKRLKPVKGARRKSHVDNKEISSSHDTNRASTSKEVDNSDVCGDCSILSITSPSTSLETRQNCYSQENDLFRSMDFDTNNMDIVDKEQSNSSPATPPPPVECVKDQDADKDSIDSNCNQVDCLLELKRKLDLFLPKRWMSLVSGEALHVIYYSNQKCFIIQRSLVVSPNGSVELFVHHELVNIEPFVNGLDPPKPLEIATINSTADRIISIVNSVWKMQVCSGYDDEKFHIAWATCKGGVIDRNPFHECRYVDTFRSTSCVKLVSGRKWRCSHCAKLYFPLRRIASAEAEKERHANTANILLTERQLLEKLANQRIELDKAKKKIYRQTARMQKLINEKGVLLDHSLSSDLEELLNNDKLTPAQSIFLQQQVKASQVKNACGMRWHPTMIRFALSVHLTSPAAYEMMRQTGMIKLPSSSTLFEYSHVKPAEEGIDGVALKFIAEKVAKFPENHKKFHVLMADEIHISQNLVFQKSTGQMIGYTSLDDIDNEVKNFEKYMDDPDTEIEESVASKMLVYMVKGVTNGIKEIVACFATKDLSANQLYVWTWKVIGALERSGIAVIAFTSDGSSVNRAFLKKNTPATIHESGITFDTLNKAAKERKVYFIADVPHLLKTIRNCLLNSRWDGKKSRRKMMKNGKKITWDFLIKLYEAKKNKSLRKSFKLNAMNVYPDSYARMKVKLAGQALSKTVCQDMRSQGWPESSETENFIERVNDWFDCLNGAHSSQGTKTRNANLAPYTTDNHLERFQKVEEFLKYLEEWENEAKNPNASLNLTLNNTAVGTANLDESEIEDGIFNPGEDTPACKKLLSSQTLEGIRMTSLAFQPLVLFMLDQGASFINARVLCQDPLEQHFSKIRAGQGGSNNPNVIQFLNRNRALHTIGELGMRKQKGNSGECGNQVKVTTDKLPKLKWRRVPKLNDDSHM